MRFVDENYDPGTDAGRGHWDLTKVKAGNLGVEFFSIWVEPEGNKGKEHQARAGHDRQRLSRVRERASGPDGIRVGLEGHLRAATRPHKRSCDPDGRGGRHAIDSDLAVLRDYYRLGVAVHDAHWSNSTPWAQSSGDLPKQDPQTGKVTDPGLNDYGRSIVREMNRIGMMVDISHVSDRTFYHALTVSRAPLIASHSSSRAITNVPRNMTDEC